MHVSDEQLMPAEALPGNQAPLDAYFGTFFQLLRETLSTGGSELGLAMSLFSLAVSIRATHVVEIGRGSDRRAAGAGLLHGLHQIRVQAENHDRRLMPLRVQGRKVLRVVGRAVGIKDPGAASAPTLAKGARPRKRRLFPEPS